MLEQAGGESGELEESKKQECWETCGDIGEPDWHEDPRLGSDEETTSWMEKVDDDEDSKQLINRGVDGQRTIKQARHDCYVWICDCDCYCHYVCLQYMCVNMYDVMTIIM